MDDKVKKQHADYLEALDRATLDIQQRLWKDLDYIRVAYEKLIYNELKTVRQHLIAVASNGPQELATRQSPLATSIDWLRFAERFRGAEERVRAMQALYVEKFAGARNVLDIGCGRGEFLEAVREAGIGARGIDLNEESVALCRSKGLDAEAADLFAYLPAIADSSLGGVYCAQVIEHIAPERLPEMIRLLSAKAAAGALAAFETPNPECLAIFASHFYIDPTHTRPVPSSLLAFYLEEAGFGHIEVRQIEPAVESWPELNELPKAVRERFFGGLDYALFARKL
jgi:O-antigen chain-terminating methyltransferase